MAKLLLDVENLDKLVKPRIESASDKLDRAFTISRSLSIPQGFRYYDYLTKLDSEIAEINKKNNSIKNWMDSSCVPYERIIRQVNINCSRLTTYSILNRVNIII